MNEKDKAATAAREEDMKTAELMRVLRKFSILGSDGTDRITILLLLDMLGSVLERLPTKNDLAQIKDILMNQQQAIAALTEATATIKKSVGEIKDAQTKMDVLTTRIAELEKIIADQETSPELATAVANVRAAANEADAALPDLPKVPPVET